MIALALALLFPSGLSPAAERSSDGPSRVRTFPGDVSICPRNDSDCRLTLVDVSLCDWLAEMLDPSRDKFHDPYNCLTTSEDTFVCLNVMTRQKADKDRDTHYTDPYLLELASLYERQLDRCLVGWDKSKGLSQAGPALVYENQNRFILLSIIPYKADGVDYDRLTLSVKDLR